MEDPLPFIYPVCSAAFVVADYVPDSATLYMRCPVCRRELIITPDRVEIDDRDFLHDATDHRK